MRSIFWRIWGAFWLALILTGTLTFLLTRFFNQDGWILSRHPGFSATAQQWLELHESNNKQAAQLLLQKTRQQYRIFTQVFNEDGKLVSASSRMRSSQQPDHSGPAHSGWRRMTQELVDSNDEAYLFVFRAQRNDLAKWQYGHGLGPVLLTLVSLVVLSLISWLLTSSITRPLSRLRHAVHELGQTSYQQQRLARLALRKDELGVLAADFNRMGQRLQDMLHSQRQLLRDVSHELRSPLARLQVALALAERADEQKRQQLWPKLKQECERLDGLIDEILSLARVEQDVTQAQRFNLCALLYELKEDCHLLEPQQQIQISCPEQLDLYMAKNLLQRALDNILRNALRFNDLTRPLEISVSTQEQRVIILIRDHGPGVSQDLLQQMTSPFVRGANQGDNGYGLGLAITERAVRQLGGQLLLDNHPQGGLQACIELPLLTA